MTSEPLFPISVFPGGRYDTRPRPTSCSWPDLARALTNFRVWSGDKLDGPMWSPARYPEGTDRRLKANVAAVSLLVLDVDDGAPLAEVLGAFDGVPRLWHTTWSHTPQAPRYRVVVPLAEEVPAAAWERVWAWAHARTGRHVDEQTKDASRAFLRPLLASIDRPHGSSVADFGTPPLAIPWDELPRPAPAPAPRAWQGPAPDAPAWKRLRAARERLKTDPVARAWVAERVGARLVGEYARDARCPKCGRHSVWWALRPAKVHGCACSHKGESCGWTGWLDELLDAAGQEVAA